MGQFQFNFLDFGVILYPGGDLFLNHLSNKEKPIKGIMKYINGDCFNGLFFDGKKEESNCTLLQQNSNMNVHFPMICFIEKTKN